MIVKNVQRPQDPSKESMHGGAESVVMGLADLIRDVVRAELSAFRPADEKPTLLNRSAIARELGTSVATVDRLCRDGLPYVRLGDVRRFELSKVLDWLRLRSMEVCV